MFERTKRVTKNGKTYVYTYLQHSVRVGRTVRSIHVKRKKGEPTGGATLLNDANLAGNAHARGEGRLTTMADPCGKQSHPGEAQENAPAGNTGEGDSSK